MHRTWSVALAVATAACGSADDPAVTMAGDESVAASSASGAGMGGAGAPSDSVGGGTAGAGGSATPAPTRIYATFVSHNEERPNLKCTEIYDDATKATYLANRALVVELAETVVDKGAAWDWQSDWEYLSYVEQWDTSDVTASTDGKNLVRWLAERDPAHVVVDAHAHETAYNYADVDYLLQGLGAPSNGVVGGFIYYPYADEVWTRLREPLTGLQAPFPTWQATTLWGGGTKNHTGPDSEASGLWRPKDPEHFFEDDPAQALPVIGPYRNNIPETGAAGLDELLAALHDGQLENNRMYTITLQFGQCYLDASRVAAYEALIDAHAQDVAAGELVWATLPAMLAAWRDEYGSTPSVYEP